MAFQHQVHALLGFPVAHALGRLTFAADGSLTASPTSPSPAAADGARLWLGDSELLVELQTPPVTGHSFRMSGGNEPRLFMLDTGSGSTYLTDHYLNEHREAFPDPPTQTAKLAGAGGEVDIPAYGAGHIPLHCGAAVILLNGPHILTQPANWSIENYEGLIGRDILDTLHSYTIDLRTMRFSVQI
jgi:hypothetical protein